VDEALEKGFADVLGVVPVGQVLVDLDQLNCYEFQTPALDSGDQLSHEPALDRIRFKQY